MATRKSAAPKKSAPAAKAPAKPARKRIDWEAVERDYRTGSFTLKELEAKHGAGFADISRRSKKDGWTKDLRKVVRQATSAAIIAESVKAAQSGAQSTNDPNTNVVVAMAEANKDVILGHRKELTDARQVAHSLLSELSEAGLLLEHKALFAEILAGSGAEPVDIAQAQASISKALGIGNRVQALKSLADAMTKIQAAERVAFGLDDKDDDKDKDSVSQALADFFGGIHNASAGRVTFAPGRKA
jgi:hypothetical protein